MTFGALVGHERSVEADFQVGRAHFVDHAQDIMMILDDGRVILQGQGNARVTSVAGASTSASRHQPQISSVENFS